MQTTFSLTQLADPDVAASEKILRTCVHCGFCTATCPTYTLLGDELDSPRGRIYLIKGMLEAEDEPVPESTVKHVDRCLSCLSCMTTCPSGVHYMHLVDHARAHIEEHYKRPLLDRSLRKLLGWLLPRPMLFRLALLGAAPVRPFLSWLPGRLGAMLRLAQAPADRSRSEHPGSYPVQNRKKRVAMLTGCAQKVLAPSINDATIRLLNRHGVEVVVPPGQGCCGSLNHHLGQEEAAMGFVKANIVAWEAEIANGGLDAIVINASGCGTTVKDYGFMLRSEPEWASRAEQIAALAKDIVEVMSELGLQEPTIPTGQRVAYHSACSMQHGQRLKTQPPALLKAAGFQVQEVPEGHLCCGSAGTYNLLQPDIASQLKARKLGNIAKTTPDFVATGNIGCITQLHSKALPVVHTVELLDWATGGPIPDVLAERI
ncbi:glycolate oxidase subunit GlcF [Lacibacterium aquatile]|uniref:Glycolate oxidase iron-sulfur subunit n=1 Tax=Lacibacterium aquatile TaxID=1168082 RepID=A0ABW5DZ76_9PROT